MNSFLGVPEISYQRKQDYPTRINFNTYFSLKTLLLPKKTRRYKWRTEDRLENRSKIGQIINDDICLEVYPFLFIGTRS
jgi:hypothetical protein